MNLTTLENLKIGQQARIVAINSNNKALKKRLTDLGIVKGAILQVVNIAPFGDPVAVNIKGFVLTIRREHLKLITGEILPSKEQNYNK